MVQEIIKENVKENDCLKETLQNVQRMLSYAVENVESPTLLSLADTQIKLKEATLCEWAQVVENTGHFLDELKGEDVDTETVFDDDGFAILLDHASLYYYVQNETERESVYRQLMINHLSKRKSEEMYQPKFHLPRPLEEKEAICQLIEPVKSGIVEGNSGEEHEQMAIESKIEGDFYMEQKHFNQAVQVFFPKLKSKLK